jgi:hypothetical protein
MTMLTCYFSFWPPEGRPLKQALPAYQRPQDLSAFIRSCNELELFSLINPELAHGSDLFTPDHPCPAASPPHPTSGTSLTPDRSASETALPVVIRLPRLA